MSVDECDCDAKLSGVGMRLVLVVFRWKRWDTCLGEYGGESVIPIS